LAWHHHKEKNAPWPDEADIETTPAMANLIKIRWEEGRSVVDGRREDAD
jgi:hypothetical protein